MKFLKKSIGAKISLLYILLAIINMSFFTIIIYENQIDLITENTRYNIKEVTVDLINSIDKILREGSFTSGEKSTINEISSLISTVTKRYAIFDEKGKPKKLSDTGFKLDNQDLLFGIRAITNREFTGKRYYSHINEKTLDLSFYIPVRFKKKNQYITLIRFSAHDMSTRLNRLYRLMTIIISIISVFHLLFALLLFRMIINPIKLLHRSSVEISKGNYSERPNIKRDDEIGELSVAFNRMADSVQDKIGSLQKQHQIMEDELEMASKVQEVIFPHIQKFEQFDFAVFNKPAEKVSGDYYDIFEIEKDKYGFLIVDVQGHGVPAAMITMLIKEKFRQHSALYDNPSALFKTVNNEIYEVLTEGDSVAGIFFTAFYMTIEPDLTINSVDAGHLRPFLVSEKNHKISLLKSGGLPMGISTELNDQYKTYRIKASPGDKIILFTDGVIEARNKKECEFGINGLISTLKKNHSQKPEELMKSVIRDFSLFTDIENLKDDATLLIIEVN